MLDASYTKKLLVLIYNERAGETGWGKPRDATRAIFHPKAGPALHQLTRLELTWPYFHFATYKLRTKVFTSERNSSVHHMGSGRAASQPRASETTSHLTPGKLFNLPRVTPFHSGADPTTLIFLIFLPFH